MTAPVSQARRWILVVDDDPTVRTLLTEALERSGYAAVGAEDGFVAEELVRDIVPDLILLDLRMPRGSGWTLLRNMEKHPRWRRIPILIVSGFLEDDAPLPATDLKIVGRLSKPVSLDDLLVRVEEALAS